MTVYRPPITRLLPTKKTSYLFEAFPTRQLTTSIARIISLIAAFATGLFKIQCVDLLPHTDQCKGLPQFPHFRFTYPHPFWFSRSIKEARKIWNIVLTDLFWNSVQHQAEASASVILYSVGLTVFEDGLHIVDDNDEDVFIAFGTNKVAWKVMLFDYQTTNCAAFSEW